MSILINGMKMPTNWRDCPFSNGTAQCKLINIEICDKQHTHRSICPLVPVPPHGRLVDMDELRKKLLSAPEARFTPKELAWVLDCEETAPTVIPAEEGEYRLQKPKEWKT